MESMSGWADFIDIALGLMTSTEKILKQRKYTVTLVALHENAAEGKYALIERTPPSPCTY